MNYFILILLLCLLVSCVIQPIEEITKEKIIVEENKTIETVNLTTSINQKIFPNTNEDPLLLKSIIGDSDFNNGVMYFDNAYSTDGVIHVLDISNIVGKQQVLLALKFKHVSGCDNEYGYYHIKPYGMSVSYTIASCLLNQQESIVFVLTDNEGRLEWYSEYAWPYEKRVEMEITALWYSQGVTIE